MIAIGPNSGWYPGYTISITQPLLLVINITSIGGCNGSVRTNGTTVGSSYQFSSSPINILSYFEIGGWSGDTARTFGGGIGEFIQYNATLSTTQIEKIEGYLSWKWGINNQLPAIHPFHNSSP